jgi:hypothetical protein
MIGVHIGMMRGQDGEEGAGNVIQLDLVRIKVGLIMATDVINMMYNHQR